MNHISCIRVPLDRVETSQQRALVESFILREGTDYGLHEKTHEHKVAQVMRRLQNGTAHIVFDLRTESFTIMSHEAWLERQRQM